MKYINCTITLILLSSIVMSCGKEWLDVKARQSQAVPSTISDYRALLDNPTLFLSASPGLTEIAADYHVFTEATWAGIKTSITANAYTWSNMNNTAYNAPGDWSTPYNAIFRANIIIEGLKKLKSTEDQAQIDFLIGEALLYRGRIFYELAMTFSPPYSSLTSNQPYGIVLRTISDIEIKPERSTIQETYDQILADLMKASELLPEKSNYVTRPSKIAAIGLLSRIYLSMEKYDSAFIYANKYLSISNVLVDYSTLPTTANFIGINVEVNHLNLIAAISGLSNYLISPTLIAKYDNNDLRKALYFNLTSNRFKGSYSKSQNDNFSGIATDEIYLNRAECLARKGKLVEALNDLNHLLQNRYRKVNGQSTYVNFNSNNEDVVLRKIIEEREKSLILRNIRWADLRRLNNDSRFARTISRTIGGSTYTLEPNSYKYTFPIPFGTVATEGLIQNPGWE